MQNKTYCSTTQRQANLKTFLLSYLKIDLPNFVFLEDWFSLLCRADKGLENFSFAALKMYDYISPSSLFFSLLVAAAKTICIGFVEGY